MKKLIAALFAAFIMMTALSSCLVTDEAYAGEVTADVVIHSGTPYYYDGALLYYLYNGYYYYPRYRGSSLYYYRYSRPLPPPRHGYRPHPVTPRRPNVAPPRGNGGPRPGSVTPRTPNTGGHGPGGARPTQPRRR